jgi:hypothetical protein
MGKPHKLYGLLSKVPNLAQLRNVSNSVIDGFRRRGKLPFYPEYNSVSTIRIRLQKVISAWDLGHFKLKIRIVLT